MNYAKGTGLTPLIIFPGGAQRTTQIVLAPASNYPSDTADDIFDFVAQSGDQDAQNYLNQGNGTYIFSPPSIAPPPDFPNPAGFIAVLRAEPSFTPQIRIGLAGLLGITSADCFNPQAMQQDWSDAVATYGNDWLTSAVQSTILGYAATYNIPLV